jgi:hypothetical protein
MSAATTRSSLRSSFRSSSVTLFHAMFAGLAGGLAIAAIGMLATAARGAGFWALPNAIGGLALGPAAGATRDLGLVTLVGVVSHVALSCGFGVITLAAIRRLGSHVATGIAAGVVLWLVNYYVIGAVLPGAHALAQLNPAWLGGSLHVVFGAVTGLVARGLDR